ncbi:uncharacterized protein HKW66_Vig0083380 [Vigna angularis]|uniref:Uncharacterized protein n=2 Tax=Phaseolus angularis TaxID=3914 RepID=A0A8T0KGU0_PHAAN|nr:uncharacterized protein HKW66_Vig0083380 [Vigna angularis]
MYGLSFLLVESSSLELVGVLRVNFFRLFSLLSLLSLRLLRSSSSPFTCRKPPSPFPAAIFHVEDRSPRFCLTGIFEGLDKLQDFQISSNHMREAEVLVLTQNNFSGELPEEIGNCEALSSVRIGYNHLVGTIPMTIGNLSSLTYFEADNNNLFGEFVAEFSQCSNLTLLNLASNGFTGTIPQDFGQLMNLQELILS